MKTDNESNLAAEELLSELYHELRNLAAAKMAREMPGQTLQPTALVHEAWLKLSSNAEQKWESRGHFFGAAAEAMRRILIDNARRKRAARHGDRGEKVDLNAIDLAIAEKDDDLLLVHDALEKLARQNREMAELVKLRFFVGFTNAEAAEILGVSVPTVERWWAFCRAWLFREIKTKS